MKNICESNQHEPKRLSFVSLLELHTFVEGQGHGLGSHFKHIVDLFVCAMVL